MKEKVLGLDQVALVKVAVSWAFMSAWQDFVVTDGKTTIRQNTTIVEQVSGGEKFQITVELAGGKLKEMPGAIDLSLGLVAFLTELREGLLSQWAVNQKTPVNFNSLGAVWSYGNLWQVGAHVSIV